MTTVARSSVASSAMMKYKWNHGREAQTQAHLYRNRIVKNAPTGSELDFKFFSLPSQPRTEFSVSTGVAVKPASQSFSENLKDIRNVKPPINQMPRSECLWNNPHTESSGFHISNIDRGRRSRLFATQSASSPSPRSSYWSVVERPWQPGFRCQKERLSGIN